VIESTPQLTLDLDHHDAMPKDDAKKLGQRG